MSECAGENCDHSSHQKLTDQVLNETPATPPVPPVDNLELAERMLEQLLPAFNEALNRLSRKETKRLMLLLVQFPFIDVKKVKLTNEQRVAFMYGERLIYANMVKRARAELDRTFGEVQKEIDQPEEKKEENAESTPTVE